MVEVIMNENGRRIKKKEKEYYMIPMEVRLIESGRMMK
jgi:hypothetical protein